MFSHSIGNETYVIKNSLDEITYRDYVNITKIAEGSNNIYYKQAEILGVLCPAHKDDFLDMTVADLTPLLNELSFLEKKVEAVERRYEFTVKGITYQVHGLDTQREFAHYEDVLSHYTDNKFDGFIHQMKFLCRKENERVKDIINMEERVELFYNLPASTVIGIAAFFLTSAHVLQHASKVFSLVADLKRLLATTLKQALTKNTVGGERLSFSQKMLRKLIVSLTLIRLRSFCN